MATSADLIRELQINAAVLTERVARHADDLGRIDPSLTRQTESVAQLTTRVAVLETKVAEFQKYLEESDPPPLGGLHGPAGVLPHAGGEHRAHLLAAVNRPHGERVP